MGATAMLRLGRRRLDSGRRRVLRGRLVVSMAWHLFGDYRKRRRRLCGNLLHSD